MYIKYIKYFRYTIKYTKYIIKCIKMLYSNLVCCKYKPTRPGPSKALLFTSLPSV